MEKKTILKIENLSKFFKSKNNYKIALDDVSFDVQEGDFLGIIGESGSGKTTLGKTIIRLNEASSGRIKLFDKNISNKKISKQTSNFIHKNMQMIFQDPLSSLNPKMNILQIISEPIKINKSIKRESEEIIEKRKKINFLFEYEILSELENNKQNYLLKYYESYEKLVNKTLNKINEFKFTNSDSWTDSFSELEVVYDYFINSEKKIIKVINEMFENTKKIFKKFEKQFQEKNFDKEFKKYTDILDKIENSEKEFNKKLKDTDIFKIQLKEINNKINFFIGKSLIENELNDLKIHIKSNINNYKIAKNKKDYNYNYLIVVRDKMKQKALNDFAKFSNVEQENILNEYFLVKEKIDDFFKNKSNEIFNSKNKNTEINFEDIDYLNIEHEIDGILSQYYIDVKKKLEIINEKNTIIVETISNEKNKILNDIREIKNKKSKIKKDFYKSECYLNDIKKLKEIKNEINLIKKNKKVEYLNLKNKGNFDLKIQIKNQKRIVKELKTTLNKKFKLLNKELLSIRPKDLKKYNKWEYWTIIKTNKKSMGEQLRIKLSSLSLIDFEFKKIIEYYSIEEKISSSNPHKLLFYKADIQTLLILNKVFNLLESVGLKKEHAYRYPHEFSGGQRQRIVIARALINDPKIIIADEAISALDVSVQAQVINMMQELSKKRNVTFLFIAHDISMVRYICNKVLIMHNGRILEKGLVNKIFKNPIHPYTKSLLKAVPELKKMDVDLSLFGDNSNYDKEYSISNPPLFIKAENDHEVLATEQQMKLWAK